MFARLLYWFELSIAFVAVGYLFLAQAWGISPEPVTKVLLLNKTPDNDAVWFQLNSGISRFWDLLAAPFLAFTVILHDEKDDFLGTLGFVCFGLLAYVFIFIGPDQPYGFYFLILLSSVVGIKTTPVNALRIGYGTLIVTGVHTWLFPDYSIGLFMYGAYACAFLGLVLLFQFARFVFRKLEISTPRTT